MSQIEKVLNIFYKEYSAYYNPSGNDKLTMRDIEQILKFIKAYVQLCDPPVSISDKIPEC